MRNTLMVAALAAIAVTQRPKVKDRLGIRLIDLADVGDSCTDSYTGYAIIEGSLERCDKINSMQFRMDDAYKRGYEIYKCKHLKVHGEMKNRKCVCKNKYKGPICNEYKGCPDDMSSLHHSSCSTNGCANGGLMAIGSDQMECICKDEWDGRFCDRLACWRLTDKGHDKRYRNAGTKCECGTHYEGDNCSILKSCENNAHFFETPRMCVCNAGYTGETCGERCTMGGRCGSIASFMNGSTFHSFIVLPLLAAVFNMLF